MRERIWKHMMPLKTLAQNWSYVASYSICSSKGSFKAKPQIKE